jgi:hypothetical protein
VDKRIGKTSTTMATGACSTSTSEPAAGTYLGRTTYAGNDMHAGTVDASGSYGHLSELALLKGLRLFRPQAVKHAEPKSPQR